MSIKFAREASLPASNGMNVIVTGGSRGIGYTIAEALAKDGAQVLILSRTKEELADAAKKLGATGMPCDVSDEKEVRNLKSVIEKKLDGRVDVLVNAAGIYGPMGLLEENDAEKWRQTFAVNVFGTMHMCALVLPYMKKHHFGRIVNFSGGGESGFPRFTAYSSSKGAIIRFTESLAAEVKESGITVNAIAPGAVNTKLMEEVLAAGAEKVGEEFYKKSLEQKENGGTSPQKTVELVRFLVSDKASLISGKMLSAVHDPIPAMEKNAEEIAKTDIFNVRRIKPEDRGASWRKNDQ